MGGNRVVRRGPGLVKNPEVPAGKFSRMLQNPQEVLLGKQS